MLLAMGGLSIRDSHNVRDTTHDGSTQHDLTRSANLVFDWDGQNLNCPSPGEDLNPEYLPLRRWQIV